MAPRGNEGGRDSRGVWDQCVCTHSYNENGQPTRTCCPAHGTLLSVTQPPRWEGSLGENGYMYTYGRVPLLSTRNYHNIVHRLYPNIK